MRVLTRPQRGDRAAPPTGPRPCLPTWSPSGSATARRWRRSTTCRRGTRTSRWRSGEGRESGWALRRSRYERRLELKARPQQADANPAGGRISGPTPATGVFVSRRCDEARNLWWPTATLAIFSNGVSGAACWRERRRANSCNWGSDGTQNRCDLGKLDQEEAWPLHRRPGGLPIGNERQPRSLGPPGQPRRRGI